MNAGRNLFVPGLLLLLLVSAVAPLQAARPERQLNPPTSHLLAPAVPLTLLKEDLAFICDEQQCKVVANYQLRAESDVTVDLAFLAPRGSRIVSMVNGVPELPRLDSLTALAAGGTARPAEALPDLAAAAGQEAYRTLLWSPRVLGAFDAANDLQVAIFSARIQAGENRVSLSYTQPLAWFETGSGGRRVSLMQYDLWPLTQWQRDPSLAVPFLLRFKRPIPGWWQGHFGRVLDIAGYTSTLDGLRTPLAEKVVQDKDDLMLRRTFSGELPARLVFVIGETKDLEANRKADVLLAP